MSEGTAMPEDIAGSTAREAAAQQPDGASVSRPGAAPSVPSSADVPPPIHSADQSAEDGDSADHVEAEDPRITADELGSVLIDAKIESIQQTPAAERTPEQIALLTAEMYRNPETPIAQAVYDKYPDGVPIGSLAVPNADGTTTMNVMALLNETVSADKNTKTYSCVVEGNDQPVSIDGEVLAKAHLKANAEYIGKVFGAPDGSITDQQKLAEWYAAGAKGEPPEVDLQAIESDLQAKAEAVKGSENNAQGMMGVAMTFLEDKIAAISTDTKDPDLQAERLKYTTSLALMQRANEVTGPLAVFAQEHATQIVIQQMGEKVPPSLQAAKAMLTESRGLNTQQMLDGLEGNIPPDQLDTMKRLLKESDPTKLFELLGPESTDDAVKALQGNPEITNLLGGAEAQQQVMAYLDRAMDAMPESEEKRKLQSLITAGKIGGGVLLAIVLLAGGVTGLMLTQAASTNQRH